MAMVLTMVPIIVLYGLCVGDSALCILIECEEDAEEGVDGEFAEQEGGTAAVAGVALQAVAHLKRQQGGGGKR